LRRDVVAVLDVSGSMSGDKLDQAKAALVQLLGTLRSGDRFRVVTFASGVHRYAAGWPEVSADNIRAAQDWVRRVGTARAAHLEETSSKRWGRSPRRSRAPCSPISPCGATASSCTTCSRSACPTCSRARSW